LTSHTHTAQTINNPAFHLHGENRPQEQWKTSLDFEFKPVEQVSTANKLQDAVNQRDETVYPSRSMVGESGPTGCLPPRSNIEAFQMIPSLHVGKEVLSVQGAAFWTVSRPGDFLGLVGRLPNT